LYGGDGGLLSLPKSPTLLLAFQALGFGISDLIVSLFGSSLQSDRPKIRHDLILKASDFQLCDSCLGLCN